MAVVEVKDILERVSKVIGTDEDSLTLMEDIQDTFDAQAKPEVDWDNDQNPHKKRAEDIAKRYKERFYGKKEDGKNAADEESRDNSGEDMPPSVEDLLSVKEE